MAVRECVTRGSAVGERSWLIGGGPSELMFRCLSERIMDCRVLL